MSPLISHGFSVVNFLVVYVMSFNNFVNILDRRLIEFLSADFFQLLRERFVRKTKRPLNAGNEDNILVVLGLFFNDAIHIFIHVCSDENVNS